MLRSEFSFKVAVGHLSAVAERVKVIGWPAAPLADVNSTFGFVKWAKLCKKLEMKPVFGVELNVTPQLGDKKPIFDRWKFLAINDVAAVNRLVAAATANPGREPSLTYEQALSAEGLIKISGERCLIERVHTNSPDLFFGLSPATPLGLARAAQRAGMQLCAISDNVFPTKADIEFYRVTLGKRSSTQTFPQWILSDDEWHAAVPMLDADVLAQAIQNRNAILQSCNTTLKKATLLVPEKKQTLREMCITGAVQLGIDLTDKIYAERLERELALIAEKNFEDYFYILSDIMRWAREKMICGPARGSSCGSLVCFLLKITTIDPIPFGLLFERFIDISRNDLPDIDVDFDDIKRQQVFDYVERKYGRERVARLGTVGMFKPRSALNQAGIALRIPRWRVEKVLDGVIERSGGDSRALLQLEDTLKGTEAGRELLNDFPEVVIAGTMEGHANNASQHAAGIVLTETSITDYVAIDSRTKSAMCDKKDAEDLNLLKIDALGLTQLSIFSRCLELLGETPRGGWLESLPLNDNAAFDVLNKGHFAGVFQFMGGALKSLTKQIEVKHIDDIIAITALARPGPMASGGANSWVRRKSGLEPVSYPHPAFEPYLRDSLGIVIYQEQVMQIGREIGDLSWDDVTALRKAMSKSLGKEYFDQFGDRFKAAAIKKGIPAESLNKIWDDLCSFGSWAFNLSHSVAYGIVSYWCCYLKAHHPVEFAAATLDAESDPARQIALLRELALEGISYVPVDAEASIDRWLPVMKSDGQRVLTGPLTQIKGIGPSAVNEILACRREGRPLRSALAKRLAEAKTEIDTLFPIRDAVKRLHPDLVASGITTVPTNIIDAQIGTLGDIVIIGVASKIAPKDENEEVNVAKRGGKRFAGPTAALNLFIRDDTDEIYCKVNRFQFERLGRPIVERGRAGKALYAIKGSVWRGFRGLGVENVKFLGFLDD